MSICPIAHNCRQNGLSFKLLVKDCIANIVRHWWIINYHECIDISSATSYLHAEQARLCHWCLRAARHFCVGLWTGNIFVVSSTQVNSGVSKQHFPLNCRRHDSPFQACDCTICISLTTSNPGHSSKTRTTIKKMFTHAAWLSTSACAFFVGRRPKSDQGAHRNKMCYLKKIICQTGIPPLILVSCSFDGFLLFDNFPGFWVFVNQLCIVGS